MLMYTMCRKSEVLRARWREFDLERGQWDIPADRMKMKAPHRVYLSWQALELLGLLKAFGAEPQAYVFPSVLRAAVPLGDATLNHFFKRLDFGVPDFSPHRTRGTAATLLREHGFSREVVELLLAHAERNKVTAAYHHHEMADERRRALQYLADQLDRLAMAGSALPEVPERATEVAVADECETETVQSRPHRTASAGRGCSSACSISTCSTARTAAPVS
jgi:integrase